ncbi:MAG: hypothetical protein ACR2PI_01925 [Hyphomicrobiaceae bacterium]
MNDAGGQRGSWRWTGMWIGTNTTGIVETLDEGLQAIRSRVTPDALWMLRRLRYLGRLRHSK